jgi:hypothetical protein
MGFEMLSRQFRPGREATQYSFLGIASKHQSAEQRTKGANFGRSLRFECGLRQVYGSTPTCMLVAMPSPVRGITGKA